MHGLDFKLHFLDLKKIKTNFKIYMQDMHNVISIMHCIQTK